MQKTRPTLEYQVNYETYKGALETALEHEIETLELQGALNDNYLIYSNKVLKWKNIKPRKYIILEARYATHWSNTFHMILTDDDTLAENFESLVQEQESEDYEQNK